MPKGVGVWDKVRLRSVGWAPMPERMGPITEEDEAEIIASLVRELRHNYGVRVSDKLEGSREKVSQSSTSEIVCLGGSNADRLGDVLAQLGYSVVKITKAGWKPTRKGVEEMVESCSGWTTAPFTRRMRRETAPSQNLTRTGITMWTGGWRWPARGR